MSFSGHSHSFDTGIAKQLGVNCAIVYNHIFYWLKTNAAKNQGIMEGKVWMYETQQQIASFLDYLTVDVVKKCIIELVKKGYLIKGNFNKNSFDRTSWYTIPDHSVFQKKITKVPIGTMGSADLHHPTGKTAPSIYDKQDKHKIKKQQHRKAAEAAVVVSASDEEKQYEEQDKAARQYMKSLDKKGEPYVEAAIIKQFRKKKFKPNPEKQEPKDVANKFDDGVLYTGKNGMKFECQKNKDGIGFLCGNHLYFVVWKIASFEKDFKELLKKLELKE